MLKLALSTRELGARFLKYNVRFNNNVQLIRYLTKIFNAFKGIM